MPARERRQRRGGGRRGSGGGSRVEVAEIQRARLLGACIGAVEELGYEHVTVADITSRARVSRRTFYELFANREQCIAAVLADTVEQVQRELGHAGLAGCAWSERVRRGLWVVLCFLDREPALARVTVVHTAMGSGPVLEVREAVLARLVALVDEGRRESARGQAPSGVVAEGVLGGALAVIHARLARGERVSGLLGELTALLVLAYLGPAAARREQRRRPPAPVRFTSTPRRVPLGDEADPLAGLPLRVTYRTARVLEGIEHRPGASNRQAGEYAGIADPGQISKLLARLARLGLVENQSLGRSKGEANAWTLTATGVQVAHSLVTRVGAGAAVGEVPAA